MNKWFRLNTKYLYSLFFSFLYKKNGIVPKFYLYASEQQVRLRIAMISCSIKKTLWWLKCAPHHFYYWSQCDIVVRVLVRELFTGLSGSCCIWSNGAPWAATAMMARSRNFIVVSGNNYIQRRENRQTLAKTTL